MRKKEKHIKKILSLMMAGVMVFSLTACGGSKKTEETKTAEAEKEEHNKKTLVLAVSILIGLIPVAVVGRNIVRKQAWKTNPKGAKEALVIAFAGGAALFAFNYGWFYLRILHEEIFKFVLFVGFLLLLIGIGVYVARKK